MMVVLAAVVDSDDDGNDEPVNNDNDEDYNVMYNNDCGHDVDYDEGEDILNVEQVG